MMNNKKKTTIAVGVVLLLATGAWALGMFGEGIDPQVAELDQQRQHIFSGDASETDRQAFRERVGELSDDQRRQLFERGRPEMRQRMADRMREVFEQPPEQLQQEIVDWVDDILDARAERSDDGDRGGRWANMSQADRDARRKQMLDMVEPSTRAQFSEYRRMIDQELESRGEDPMSGRDFRSLMGGKRGR